MTWYTVTTTPNNTQWLKDRFNNEHSGQVENPYIISKHTTVSEHFVTNDHSDNITLIPLELIKSNRDSVRKARVVYLIERGKTLEPSGMNEKDEM